MRFTDRVVVISGAGSIGPGMSNGRAAALKFGREGARVVAVDRNLASAQETVDLIRREGGKATAVAANVIKAAEVEQAVAAAIAEYGQIDVLFNNVGGGWGTDMVNTPEEQWNRTYDVCVKSVFLFSKYTVPQMRKAGGGVIVNNSSIDALYHDSIFAYNSAKAAVLKLTKDMAYEYGRENIRVNCVVPGLIDSALARLRVAGDERADAERQRKARELVPLGRYGRPDEIASAVLFLASDEASYCNGACLVVDGGLTCH